MAKTKTDEKTLELIKEVQRRKEEIAAVERPVWRTNCVFSYVEGKINDAIPLHTVSNVKALILIAAFLIDKEQAYIKGAALLGIEPAPAFTWNGFTTEDWIEDLKLRAKKIQISALRKKLEEQEARLDRIISPSLRAKMELEEIEKELG